MTTGRINQVTEATRRGEPSRRLRLPTAPFHHEAADHPLASGRSDFDHTTLGGAPHKHPAVVRRSVLLPRCDAPPGCRALAGHPSSGRRLRRPQPTTIPRRSRERGTRAHGQLRPTAQPRSAERGNGVHPNRNSPYKTSGETTAFYVPKRARKPYSLSPLTANDGGTMQTVPTERPRATRPRSPTTHVWH